MSLEPLAATPLFQPLRLGAITLEHRVILAPLTRMRASKESDGVFVPNDLLVEYYSQRASKGGLLLTEATPIGRYVSSQRLQLMCFRYSVSCISQGKLLTNCKKVAGYPNVPGIFTQSQIAAWKRVTDAVHAKGGFIFCQLWHVGRATTPGFLGGKTPLSASSIPITGKALDGTEYADHPPKAMSTEEIKETVEEFASAAKRAVEAGFDGVEIHGMLLLPLHPSYVISGGGEVLD